MINFDIDELKKMRETLTHVENTLEKEKKKIEDLIAEYKEEMKIEEEWSSDAYQANKTLLAAGVEYYEDIYGEIGITKKRIAEFNKSVTHFLADMLGLDDGTKDRLGYISTNGPEFNLSSAEEPGKDAAQEYRRQGGSPREDSNNEPENNKPTPPSVHFRSGTPENEPRREIKYLGNVDDPMPLPPSITPTRPYQDLSLIHI